MAWYIRYGMGGGYGGTDNCDWEEVKVENLREAEEWANELANDEFESSGEFDYDAFHEEYPDATDEEKWEAYCQERESWVEYEARESDTNPNEDE